MKLLFLFIFIFSNCLLANNSNNPKNTLIECDEKSRKLNMDCLCDSRLNDLIDIDGNKVCVPKCNDGFERIGKNCLKSCDETEKRNEQGICVACSGTNEWVGDKCVAKCGNNNQRAEDGQCQQSCSEGYEKIDNSCVPICPTKTERVGMGCQPLCPEGSRRDDGGICRVFLECKQNEEIVGDRCVRKCHPKKQKRDPNSGMCINQIPCNPGFVEFKGKCRAECPPGQERVEIEGQINDQCVNQCPMNYKRNTNGVCVFCQQ